MEVGGQREARDALPPKRTWAYCVGGWVGPRVWTDSENLAPTGLDPRTVQPVESRYTDYATPVHELITVLT